MIDFLLVFTLDRAGGVDAFDQRGNIIFGFIGAFTHGGGKPVDLLRHPFPGVGRRRINFRFDLKLQQKLVDRLKVFFKIFQERLAVLARCRLDCRVKARGQLF